MIATLLEVSSGTPPEDMDVRTTILLTAPLASIFQLPFRSRFSDLDCGGANEGTEKIQLP